MLVSGFRPWTGVTYNPSGVVATRLDGQRIRASGGYPHDATVRGIVLDVAWTDGRGAGGAAVQGAARALSLEAGSYNPHLIVSFGVLPQEAYKFDVEPEATDRSRNRDVLGNLPPSERLYPSETETLPLSFAVQRIVQALNRTLPRPFHAVSEPGLGYYLCERIAYEGARLQKMSVASAGGTSPSHLWASGFIHVPNPLFAVRNSSDADIATLTADEQRRLHGFEDTIVAGADLAVRTALGQLPSTLR